MKTIINKKIAAFFSAGLLLSTVLIFSACTVDVTIQVNKTGSINVNFFAGAGDAFTQMIESASGQTSEEYIDTREIQYELAKAGFSKVNIASVSGTNIAVGLTDAEKKSYLFTTGILSESQGNLSANINPVKLKKFYDSSDEQTKMVLDILLVPIFNDEVMTQDEYLEMMGTVYGADVQNEISKSYVNLSLINADGKRTNKRIPLVELLTLMSDINF